MEVQLSVQSKDAAKLREKLEDKPCEHPHCEKEYYLGSQTGDYACTTCGDVFYYTEYEKIKADRRAAEKQAGQNEE